MNQMKGVEIGTIKEPSAHNSQ